MGPSWIRSWIHASCIGRQTLCHWATSEVFLYNFYSIFFNHHCNREEQNLTPCWICFLQPLLSVAFVTTTTKRTLSVAMSMHNGCVGNPAPLPECSTKVPLFGSQGDILTLPTCEWLPEGRNELIPTSPPRGWPTRRYFARLMVT